MAGMESYDAVVLAGGQARRMGGVDKPGRRVGGLTLLERVVRAVEDAGQVVVVGPDRPLPARVDTLVREEPAGGGPVAALAVGVREVQAPVTVVLAADLPFLDRTTVDLLRALLARGPDLALATDAAGRDQYLLAAWRTSALRTALAAVGDPTGAPLRRLVQGVSVGRLTGDALGSAGGPAPWFDCDTDEDVTRARRWAE